MAEGCRTQGQDRRAHLRVRDNLDTEDIGQARAAVAAEGTEDEVLTLLVEDEDAREHDCGWCITLQELRRLKM